MVIGERNGIVADIIYMYKRHFVSGNLDTSIRYANPYLGHAVRKETMLVNAG